jgi:hypothetical protein
MHTFDRLFSADEGPSQLMIALQLLHDLLAGIEIPCDIGCIPRIRVGYGHLDIAGIRIGVPVGNDVEPCVQRRDDDYPQGDHHGHRVAHQTNDIAKEDA